MTDAQSPLLSIVQQHSTLHCELHRNLTFEIMEDIVLDAGLYSYLLQLVGCDLKQKLGG